MGFQDKLNIELGCEFSFFLLLLFYNKLSGKVHNHLYLFFSFINQFLNYLKSQIQRDKMSNTWVKQVGQKFDSLVFTSLSLYLCIINFHHHFLSYCLHFQIANHEYINNMCIHPIYKQKIRKYVKGSSTVNYYLLSLTTYINPNTQF